MSGMPRSSINTEGTNPARSGSVSTTSPSNARMSSAGAQAPSHHASVTFRYWAPCRAITSANPVRRRNSTSCCRTQLRCRSASVSTSLEFRRLRSGCSYVPPAGRLGRAAAELGGRAASGRAGPKRQVLRSPSSGSGASLLRGPARSPWRRGGVRRATHPARGWICASRVGTQPAPDHIPERAGGDWCLAEDHAGTLGPLVPAGHKRSNRFFEARPGSPGESRGGSRSRQPAASLVSPLVIVEHDPSEVAHARRPTGKTAAGASRGGSARQRPRVSGRNGRGWRTKPTSPRAKSALLRVAASGGRSWRVCWVHSSRRRLGRVRHSAVRRPAPRAPAGSGRQKWNRQATRVWDRRNRDGSRRRRAGAASAQLTSL